jgi:hypothetical protein
LLSNTESALAALLQIEKLWIAVTMTIVRNFSRSARIRRFPDLRQQRAALRVLLAAARVDVVMC